MAVCSSSREFIPFNWLFEQVPATLLFGVHQITTLGLSENLPPVVHFITSQDVV